MEIRKFTLIVVLSFSFSVMVVAQNNRPIMRIVNAIAIGIIGAAVMTGVPAEASCFEDWSHCTPATSMFTGIAWQNCLDHCKCLGWTNGACRLVPNTCVLISADTLISQCHCFGQKYSSALGPCGM